MTVGVLLTTEGASGKESRDTPRKQLRRGFDGHPASPSYRDHRLAVSAETSDDEAQRFSPSVDSPPADDRCCVVPNADCAVSAAGARPRRSPLLTAPKHSPPTPVSV